MAEDWLTDVQKYAPNADTDAVAGIVRYCGIALRNRDSSLVSFSSPDEIGRVRENFLKKKLGLTDPDATLDEAIAAVGQTMREDRTKNRVTVYYLLADRFNQLHLFKKPGSGGAAASAAAAAPVTDEPEASNDLGLAGAAAGGVAGLTAAGISAASEAATPAAPDVDPTPAYQAPAGEGGSRRASILGASAAEPVMDEPDGGGGSKWWLWLILGLVALAILFFLLRGCGDRTAQAPVAQPTATETTTTTTTSNLAGETAANSAAVAPEAAAPAGAGVVAETRDNLPALKVYFDTGKSAVSADLANASGSLRDYLAAHPTAKAVISGFNDPTGNAAANAALSKTRAEQVAAALEKAGVPASAVVLEKPANATSAGTGTEARRVEVTVRP